MFKTIFAVFALTVSFNAMADEQMCDFEGKIAEQVATLRDIGYSKEAAIAKVAPKQAKYKAIKDVVIMHADLAFDQFLTLTPVELYNVTFKVCMKAR